MGKKIFRNIDLFDFTSFFGLDFFKFSGPLCKDLTNLTDMNLQHPELIPLIMMAEPVLKENEWFEIKGLMSRSSNSNTTATGNGSHHYNTRSGICCCAISRNFCSQNLIFL